MTPSSVKAASSTPLKSNGAKLATPATHVKATTTQGTNNNTKTTSAKTTTATAAKATPPPPTKSAMKTKTATTPINGHASPTLPPTSAKKADGEQGQEIKASKKDTPHVPPSSSSHAAATPHEFEFFGPHVPLLLVVTLPLVLYGLIYGCNASGCFRLYPLPISWGPGFPSLGSSSSSLLSSLFSMDALLVYLGWFFGLAALHLVLPGRIAQGTVLPDGSRLNYKLNAFPIFLLTYGSALYFGFFTDRLDLGWIYDNYLQLLTASILFSTLLSFYLYITSFKKGAMVSVHGDTGYPHYDFWMGRELNPRIGRMFDLKEFCELYPGIIGWVIINLAMAQRQYKEMGYVTNAMAITNLFQLYYAVDALWNEKAILTTMDITSDGFGYMLAFGDLAWVPFGFSNAARYLLEHPQNLSLPMVIFVVGVKALGYYVFRGANGQKDTFRRDPHDPSVRHLKTLQTKRGTRLIISGWWGMSRHINYLGDWIMGVAWCLPCGFAAIPSVLPYFYCLYFACLLVHRERRDDLACRHKYGADWDRYCSIVRWRIIPFVY